jgi:hypothetical protein
VSHAHVVTVPDPEVGLAPDPPGLDAAVLPLPVSGEVAEAAGGVLTLVVAVAVVAVPVPPVGADVVPTDPEDELDSGDEAGLEALAGASAGGRTSSGSQNSPTTLGPATVMVTELSAFAAAVAPPRLKGPSIVPSEVS